jgi:hypothetical protein
MTQDGFDARRLSEKITEAFKMSASVLSHYTCTGYAAESDESSLPSSVQFKRTPCWS